MFKNFFRVYSNRLQFLDLQDYDEYDGWGRVNLLGKNYVYLKVKKIDRDSHVFNERIFDHSTAYFELLASTLRIDTCMNPHDSLLLSQKIGSLHELLSGETTECSALLGKVRDNFCQNFHNLLTFNQSLIDQMPWERVSDVKNHLAAESVYDRVDVNLYRLIQNFLLHTVLPAIFGSSLSDEFFIDLHKDLIELNPINILLSQGGPWFDVHWLLKPVTLMSFRSLAALKQYHSEMREYIQHENDFASYNGQGFEDASCLVFSIHKLIFSIVPSPKKATEIAAIESILLIWTIITCLTNTIFWTLVHAHQSKEFTESLRQSTSQCIRVTQPPPFMMFEQPPVYRIDMNKIDECTLLVKSYMETIRLCSQSWGILLAKENCTLDTSANKKFTVAKNTRLIVATRTLPFSNDCDTQWNPQRFSIVSSNISEFPGQATKTPWNHVFLGIGAASFACQKITCMFVATFLGLWRIVDGDKREDTEGGGIFIRRGEVNFRVTMQKVKYEYSE